MAGIVGRVTTSFPVYSIAKTFLAESVLELGIPLTDAIGDHLEGLAETYANREIGSLLNHTSGLSDYSELPEYHQAVASREPAWSRADLLKRAESLPYGNPGFHYSNIGYFLLRILLEDKNDSSMFQAIKDLVLQPLGITGFSEWEQESSLVPGYDPKWVYSGTFLANKRDLVEGYTKLIKHRAQRGTLGDGLTPVPHSDTGFVNPHYGFGTMCDVDKNTGIPKFVGHGGGGPGFAHMLLVNTETWKAEIETSNSDFNQRDAILRLREATSS